MTDLAWKQISVVALVGVIGLLAYAYLWKQQPAPAADVGSPADAVPAYGVPNSITPVATRYTAFSVAYPAYWDDSSPWSSPVYLNYNWAQRSVTGIDMMPGIVSEGFNPWHS